MWKLRFTDLPKKTRISMSKAELQRDQLHFTAESAEYLGIEMYNKLVNLGIAGKKAKKIGIK